MKLRAKIYHHYLKQLLDREKECEFRQLESIILKDSKTGKEYEFEILSWGSRTPKEAKNKFPDINWDMKKQVLFMRLGSCKKVKKSRSKS